MAKSKKTTKKKTAKKSTKKSKTKKSDKKKAPYSDSNKAVVYRAWDAGEKDVEALHKKVDKAVKESTIKGWTRGWAKGKRLPAIAKD